MRKFLGYLAFFLIPVMMSSVVKAQEDAGIRTLLNEAEACIAGRNLPEALAKTREALRISPDNIPAMLKQINVFFLMNDDKEAMRSIEEAIGRYPDEPDFYYMRGVIHNAREKYGRALGDFDRGLELKPSLNVYKYYLGRGVSHLNLLEYDQALSDLSTAIDMNDTLASAYPSRAMVNYDIRDYHAAVNDFLKALDYSKGNSALYFNLGMSYFRLNEKDKACPNFHKACTLGNTNACRMALMECAKSIPSVP